MLLSSRLDVQACASPMILIICRSVIGIIRSVLLDESIFRSSVNFLTLCVIGCMLMDQDKKTRSRL